MSEMPSRHNLYGWQESIRVMVEESDLCNNIMLIAPTMTGKSYILDTLAEGDNVGQVEGGYNLTSIDIEPYYQDNEVVLIDEGGMLTDYQGIIHLLEEYPDIQTVLATVPDCPPMEIMKPRFDLVVDVSESVDR